MKVGGIDDDQRPTSRPAGPVGSRRLAARIDLVRRRLAAGAGLFDDPAAYLAGVDDTLEALAAEVAPDAQPEPSDPCPEYLAALAVGLLSAERSREEIDAQLLDAAGGDLELLAVAAQRAETLDATDEVYRLVAASTLRRLVQGRGGATASG